MQSMKDAIVVLGVLLLLVSVKVVPLESAGDVFPSAEASSAQTDGGTELAGLFGQASAAEPSNPAIEQIQFDAEVHDCEPTVIRVRTLEFEESGDRIILRIDTRDGQTQVERLEVIEPAPVPEPRNEVLEACKIG